jgi:REP element-mobilizing transposase RayT
MANTYTQIHIQLIFAVKYRKALIHKGWKNELYKYMTGIIQNRNHKLLAINGVEDHIHILIGQRPDDSLSELVKNVKAYSSKWINNENFCSKKFQWQEGFGGFAYSKSQMPNVIRYIHRQEEHHKKIFFLDEYETILKNLEIDYDAKYIFNPPE